MDEATASQDIIAPPTLSQGDLSDVPHVVPQSIVDQGASSAQSSGSRRVSGPRSEEDEFELQRNRFHFLRSYLWTLSLALHSLLRKYIAFPDCNMEYPSDMLLWLLMHSHLAEPYFPESPLHPPIPNLGASWSAQGPAAMYLEKPRNPFILLALRSLMWIYRKSSTLHSPSVLPVASNELISFQSPVRLSTLVGLSFVRPPIPFAIAQPSEAFYFLCRLQFRWRKTSMTWRLASLW